MPQFFQHFPMPLRKRTETYSIKQSQSKPRQTGQSKQNKISQPCFAPYPSKNIEKR